MGKISQFALQKPYLEQSAGYNQGRVILQTGSKDLRVVLEGGLYSRAGSVTGFTVYFLKIFRLFT